MRALVLVSFALLALTLHAGVAAAACDDDDGDAEACEDELAAFDDEFGEDATFLEQIQLAIGGRFLHALLIRYEDDDERYVEFEEENELGDDPFDDLDPDELDDRDETVTDDDDEFEDA